jgi:signal transduction histidine kinase
MDTTEKKSIYFFLLLALLCLVVGIWGTFRLSQRPGLKAALEAEDGHLRLGRLSPVGMAAESGLKKGDIILQVDKKPIQSSSDFNFYVDQKKAGESINLSVQRSGEELNLTVSLAKENGGLFIIVHSLIGLFLWIVGVFVFLKNPRSRVTRIFLISSLAFSLAIFISWEGFPFGPKVLSLILPFVQIFAYTLLPALFFHFSIVYPKEEEASIQKNPLIYSIYLPSLVLILLMELFYWRAILTNSLSIFQVYKSFFLYSRLYLVVYVVFGLLVLFQTYRKLEFLEDKRKVKWIFWGIVVGTFPFFFLYVFPDVFLNKTFISEITYLFFMLVIPISFAFSILKYQAMDIDVVVNRSLVYSLLTGFIVGIYLLTVGLLGEVLYRATGYEGRLFPILGTLVAALLFTPAKNRIRVLVDKTFYRVKYDYRKAIQKFNRQVDLAFTHEELLELLLKKLDLLLAVKRAMILLRKDDSNEFKIAKWFGFSEEEIREIDSQKNSLPVSLFTATAVQGAKGSTDFRVIQALPENQTLKKYEIKLSFPPAEKEELSCLLLVGNKKSGLRYSAEDVELVSQMVQEVVQALQNMKMRERIMIEQLEKEKLKELDKMKTKFISNVSHDLRTPLTAIRFSVDNMLSGVCGDLTNESRRCLQMIKESTLHFSRMIENLLILSTSESGKMTLSRETLPLNLVLDEACNMVTPLAEKKGINLVKERRGDISVYADKHCLLQILLNLLDNAVKYTDSGGRVTVSAKRLESEKLVELAVTDNGVGISPENLERIFERFHKVSPTGTVGEKGLGIGLDIVRNLVHLHGGEIKVESPVPETGRGAKFSFTLPQG